MKKYEKEGFYPKETPGFGYEWFVFEPLSKEECKGMPEWEDMEGAYKTPETEKEWKEARLYEWDGGEVGDEICDDDNLEEGISYEFINYLKENGYEVTLKVEHADDIKPLKITKMGRKRIVNIPAKDGRFCPGNGVRLLKMDGTGPRGQKGRCQNGTGKRLYRNRNL